MKRRNVLLSSIAAPLISGCGKFGSDSALYHEIETKLPLRLFSASGDTAEQTLKALEEDNQVIGSPFIIGSQKELEYLQTGTFAEGTEDPKSTVARAEAASFPIGFRKKLVTEAEDAHDILKNDPRWATLAENLSEFRLAKDLPIGAWPDDSTSSKESPTLAVTTNWMTKRPYTQIYIGVVPTQNPAEIPAYISFGGWNECPLPEWHTAALRHWSNKWGARIMALTSDTMEVRVSRTPETRKAALELAREHYDYCNDIVDQGTGSLANLAHGLMFSDLWFFWWD